MYWLLHRFYLYIRVVWLTSRCYQAPWLVFQELAGAEWRGGKVRKERKMKIAKLIGMVKELGRVPTAKAAWEVGWSYNYLRYVILREVMAITECISYDKEEDEIVWSCEERVDS